MSLNLQDKIARQRLSVLQLAEALDNVSIACRQRDMTRTQFYDYKRRFELQGLEGLKDLPPIHKSHPQATPPKVVERILALSLTYPAWGCVRLSERLRLDGTSVSSPAIQSILIKHGMASKFDRLLKLQEQVAAEAIELSPEQILQGEHHRPNPSDHCGEQEGQDTEPYSHQNLMRARWAGPIRLLLSFLHCDGIRCYRIHEEESLCYSDSSSIHMRSPV